MSYDNCEGQLSFDAPATDVDVPASTPTSPLVSLQDMLNSTIAKADEFYPAFRDADNRWLEIRKEREATKARLSELDKMAHDAIIYRDDCGKPWRQCIDLANEIREQIRSLGGIPIEPRESAEDRIKLMASGEL
jgi:hypothetical protein